MKIITFAVNNFRSINGGLDKNRINFENSNTIFIFGQNNVGKSTFLKAYEFFVSINDKTKDSDHYNQKKDNIIEFEIEIEIEDEDAERCQNLLNYNSFSQKKDNKNRIKVKKISDPQEKTGWRFQTFNHGNGKWEEGQSFGLGNVFGSVLPTPIFIKAMPSEDDVKETLNNILKIKAEKQLKSEDRDKLEGAKKIIKELQDQMYGITDIEKYKKKINEEFQKMFPDLMFDISESDKVKFTHDKMGRDFDVNCKNIKNDTVGEDGERKFQLPETLISYGHGTVRSAIFTFLMLQDEIEADTENVKKDVIILFEEPELFLHPKLTKQLRSLMYEVSKEGSRFQVLCASHSPQMIDISKDHTSLVRMVKDFENKTELYQAGQENLDFEKKDSSIMSIEEKKKKLHEILRFNPHICESFYADEVVLVEGDTEAIIFRAFMEVFGSNNKDIFIVNCATVNNIPFYQKIFSKFNIPYSVICDTDHISDGKNMNVCGWNMDCEQPVFGSHIQKKIYDQFNEDFKIKKSKYFFVFNKTFEPAHMQMTKPFDFDTSGTEGKPFNANRYWEEKLLPNKDNADFEKVPIINYIKKILA